eukprot:17343-Heterococcus_DN1.PRE.1
MQLSQLHWSVLSRGAGNSTLVLLCLLTTSYTEVVQRMHCVKFYSSQSRGFTTMTNTQCTTSQLQCALMRFHYCAVVHCDVFTASYHRHPSHSNCAPHYYKWHHTCPS